MIVLPEVFVFVSEFLDNFQRVGFDVLFESLCELGEHWGALVLTDTPKSELGEHGRPLALTEVLRQRPPSDHQNPESDRKSVGRSSRKPSRRSASTIRQIHFTHFS